MGLTLRALVIACLVTAAGGGAGCGSTRITDTWKAPVTRPAEFKKVVVMAISSDPWVRRIAEEEMVHQVTGPEAIPAYRVLGDDEVKQLSTVKSRLMRAGFDGAITLRLVGAKDRTSWQPGALPSQYVTFTTYHAWAWPVVGDTGHLRTDSVMRVETNVYSLDDGRLLWSGLSETFNPLSIRELVTDVLRVVAGKLRSQGVLS